MTFNFDEAVRMALRTWYPEDHPLYPNYHHALGKHAGEWGEVLEDYMKTLYKPDYQSDIEKELGDVWYYIRVLCHLYDYIPIPVVSIEFNNDPTDYLIASISEYASSLFKVFCRDQRVMALLFRANMNLSYTILIELCRRYDITLQQLTESNWEKLKPGSERGEQWAKARTVSLT